MGNSYLAYGLILDSDTPLALAPQAPAELSAAALGSCRITLAGKAFANRREVTWYHHHDTPDCPEPWLSLGRCDGWHVFSFRNGPCFRVDEAGSQIDVYESDADRSEIEASLLNHVVPLTLAHRGAAAFHASAIEFPAGAALFIGETGAGKSTLARHLAGAGHRLLSDDCAVLDPDETPPLVFPGYPVIRVIDDSASTTQRMRGKAVLSPPEFPFLFSPEPATVAAVFQLDPEPAEAITIEPLSTRDTQFALTRHAFRLDPGNREKLSDEFKLHAAIARHLPAFRLSYPRVERLLPTLCDSIRCHLGKCRDSRASRPPSAEKQDVRSL